MGESIHKFIETRRSRWENLESLVQVLEKGRMGQLKGGEILQMGRLYREATADLARLQAFRDPNSAPEELEVYLNQLVARSYAQIYRTPSPGWDSLWRFLASTFPKVFRATLPWTLLAMGIFAGGFLYGALATITDEGFIVLVAPPQLIEKVEEGKVWFDSILSIGPLASSMIMTNNISVTFLAFALGMTFGLGTIYLMAFNGLLVGALAAFCHMHGLGVPFWSFVLPHGVIELTAIFVGGGGGLVLASALLLPGDLPRKDALIEHGRQAVRLALGCVPLLVVAGIVEGFFSPAHLPAWFKFLAAGLLFALLLCYLLLPYKRPFRFTSR